MLGFFQGNGRGDLRVKIVGKYWGKVLAFVAIISMGTFAHAKGTCSHIFDTTVDAIEFELISKSIWVPSSESVDLIEIYKIGDVFATGKVVFIKDFDGNIQSTHIIVRKDSRLNFDMYTSSSGETEYKFQMHFPKDKYQIVLSRKDRHGHYEEFFNEDL